MAPHEGLRPASREAPRSFGSMSMSNANHSTPRRRLLDNLFVGGCTAAYVVLIGAVLAALKLYGS
jgi:hypothetical protein